MYAQLNTTHKLVVTALKKPGYYKHEIVNKATGEVIGKRTGFMCFIAAEVWPMKNGGYGKGSYFGRLDLAVKSKAPIIAYIEDKPPFEIGN